MGSAPGQRLLQDEARLRQRPFARVDQEHRAVHHVEAALDLAAEIGVARRVHDVDLDRPVADGGVLGHDRDAALAFEVQRIHDALHDLLVVAEGAGLPEHAVDERRLAVVDVGDDGDVSNRVFSHESHLFGRFSPFYLKEKKGTSDAHRGALLQMISPVLQHLHVLRGRAFLALRDVETDALALG